MIDSGAPGVPPPLPPLPGAWATAGRDSGFAVSNSGGAQGSAPSLSTPLPGGGGWNEGERGDEYHVYVHVLDSDGNTRTQPACDGTGCPARGGRWFAPSAFKKYKRAGSFSSVYHAYFTYDADTRPAASNSKCR
ncbi:hypothetical protein [Nocardia sp. NPDC049707]|uniref:hypothetical protein n=1 Tax=Nocardia sp. NPDC049707 TaxID=3154735 RepID=UPI0034180B62